MSSRCDRTGATAPVTAAVCGLYCDACTLFIGSHEDPERLALSASRMGWDLTEAYCDGCRAERRTPYCRTCDLYACADRRGHSFCQECEDYPCAELESFRQERPHRTEILDNLDRIAEAGVDTWLREVKSRYSCRSCGTLNSAYDLKCRACGHEPSCEYVAAHQDAIVKSLIRR